MVTHKAWEKNLLIKYLCPRDFRRGEMEEKMKKLDPVVIIVDVLLLIGCGCMFLYGKMSAHSLFVVGIILVGVLVLYLYVTNYKDNHYGGKFHQDF